MPRRLPSESKLALQQKDTQREPIAIIGIGCRFPGGVDSPEKFWSLLSQGIDVVSEIPSDRMDVNRYYDPRPAIPGRMMTRWGGFLGNIDGFDAEFFGISPREAERMDPQQRLLLEVAWESLEDAGLVPEQYAGSRAGVFIGLWLNDFESRLFADPSQTDFYMTTGSGRYAASGRLSYFFGFQGPSITIDTACSSSLVAIHLACQSLQSGESSIALAGGANILLQPHISIAYSQSKMMAPDGHCKFGDAQADGYVRSEGAALVVLKLLSQAQADHDPIYAIIRGGAVNNDGRSSGFLATPGQSGQEELLRLAYRNAGIDPGQVQYIEAHGTGTRAGDPIELGALGAVVGSNRSSAAPCFVGSVKTNLGHTEGAAGVAGLIKVALSLKNRLIPPSLHLQTFNPDIPWKEVNLTIPRELTPWPEGSDAIAGVSAFGIAGTNAHLVLAEAPKVIEQQPYNETASIHILPFSGHSSGAVRVLAESYSRLLNNKIPPPLNGMCYTASCRRTHHAERLAIVGKSYQDFDDQISHYLQQTQQADESIDPYRIDKRAKVVFVFPGQGAQWHGMGRELMEQNLVFRESLSNCERALAQWSDWSLLEQLSLDEDSPAYRLKEISVIQPTLFAIEVALADVWRSWGVEPSAVIGHSMGEVAAAYVAGALTLDDAARVICKRSQLMQRTSGMGAMAVIGLPFAEMEKRLNGYAGQLSIAVQNSPRSTVVSGDSAALEALIESLRSTDVFCRLIKVDVASHSPQMDPIRPDLVESLKDIQTQATVIPFYSTVTGNICEGRSLAANYWGRNLRESVRFSSTIERLIEDDHMVFIELSPHPTLLSSIEEICAGLQKVTRGFASLRREQPELETMLTQLGSLYMSGYDIDWNNLYQDGGQLVALPGYPWQRNRYWFETSVVPSKQTRPGAHPLLGQYLHSATGIHIWETNVSTRLFPYLKDHQVRGRAIFPAAGYLEMVLAAASEIFNSRSYILKDISFHEALAVHAEEHQIIQLMINADSSEIAEFRFYTRSSKEDPIESWTLNATGSIELGQEKYSQGIDSPKDLLTQHKLEGSAEEFYRTTSRRGLDYGKNFQAITSLSQNTAGLLAKIELSEELREQTAEYRIHPVLLDACFQTLLAALPESNSDTYLPTSLEAIQTQNAPHFGGALWSYVLPKTVDNRVTGDICLFNEDGSLVMFAKGLGLQKLDAKPDQIGNFVYEVKWQESPIPYQDQTQARHWLIFADRHGLGESLVKNLQQDSQTCTVVFVGSTYKSISPNLFELDPSQPVHFQQLFRDLSKPIHGIVHLWSLENRSAPTLEDSNLISILHLVQAIAQSDGVDSPRLWLVTRGTQSVLPQPEPISVNQAAVWGMGAVIANEFPSLHCTRLDLSPNPMQGEAEQLAWSLQANDNEDQVAWRNTRRYVARLKQHPLPAEPEVEAIPQRIEVDRPFQVQVTKPGILDDFSLIPILKKSPNAGEVEIEVRATGLNFMNVMSAMGICPGYRNGIGPLGIECSGIVLRVGEGVIEFQPGDEVAAIAFDCLGSHAITDARLVVKKPPFINLEEAASIPIAFVTAYYALHYLGRLQAGERVLIHSASGGVGLAAIQLARGVGAEIFATAGSPEKRELLQGMGIQHVMDSRSLSFAEEVMQQTHGEGVDMVLNSLTGSAISKALDILKPYGRFMEIGKRDIYQNSKVGLSPFRNNLSYFAIDLDKISRERADIVGKLLRQVFDLIAKREITPLPIKNYPVSKARDAFRLMEQAKHVGKITITMKDPNASFDRITGATAVQTEATYLITGGLGGLGLTFANWLAKLGARHIVLVGRNKPSQKAQKVIDELRTADVNVRVAQVDVTNIAQLSELLAQVNETMPPIKGAIHAAGLLADGTILQMDQERFMQALAPKVLGAWNLHTLTMGQPLDFFILFSSIAALLGTPGQVNYAAGNAFLDGLARYRHSQNLPALSINWGPWDEIGLASAQEVRGQRLSKQGLGNISPAQGLEAMPLLIAQGVPQISFMSLDVSKWCEAQPAAAASSLFRELLSQTDAETNSKSSIKRSIRDELLSASSAKQRRALFENLVREHVAQVLHLAPSRIPIDKPLRTLGLDSLMSIELRNKLEDSLHITLSASLIWNYPTVRILTSFLAEKVGIVIVEEDPHTETAPIAQFDSAEEAGSAPNRVFENLPKDELDAMLREELDALENLLGDN